MKMLLIGAGLAVLPTLIAFLLPRKKTFAFGVKCGKSLSTLLRGKLGRGVEDRLELTVKDFSDGWWDGARRDNEEAA